MRRGALRAAAALVAVVALSASASPARAAEPDADPWLGKDKAFHFAVAGGIAAGGYVVGAFVFDARGHAMILGGSLAMAVGIGKELVDLTGAGDPSWKDLTWDGIGAVAGVAGAWAVDLLVRGAGERHPLFVAPSVTRESAGLVLMGRF